MTIAFGMPAIRTRIKGAPLGWITVGLFLACFAPALAGLVRAWLTLPEAAHGVLIAPVAVWLAWRSGLVELRQPARVAGAVIILIAIFANLFGRVAGVETIPRVAFFMAGVGVIVWYVGWRQVVAWWLPLVLLALTIPMPESLIATLTAPLQETAARMGAGMLAWRHIPVLLAGNVIRLPGHTLFVSEACSGLRSLTALLSMAILVGALFLRYPLTRVLMVGLSVALAIIVNGVRIFLTGFLVFFVDPKLGEGFMHITEGYLLFLVSLSILALLTWGLLWVEGRFQHVSDA